MFIKKEHVSEGLINNMLFSNKRTKMKVSKKQKIMLQFLEEEEGADIVDILLDKGNTVTYGFRGTGSTDAVIKQVIFDSLSDDDETTSATVLVHSKAYGVYLSNRLEMNITRMNKWYMEKKKKLFINFGDDMHKGRMYVENKIVIFFNIKNQSRGFRYLEEGTVYIDRLDTLSKNSNADKELIRKLATLKEDQKLKAFGTFNAELLMNLRDAFKDESKEVNFHILKLEIFNLTKEK